MVLCSLNMVREQKTKADKGKVAGRNAKFMNVSTPYPAQVDMVYLCAARKLYKNTNSD